MTQLSLLPTLPAYLDRKARGCTYPGCDKPHSETSVECEEHRRGTVERQRLYRMRRRFVTLDAPLAAAVAV